MNSRVEGNGINSEQAALNLVQQVRFSGTLNPSPLPTFLQLILLSGLTPLGTQLDAKIIQPLLLGPARSNQLKKPLLIVILTDGTPAGEPKEQVFNVIMRTNQELQRTRVRLRAFSNFPLLSIILTDSPLVRTRRRFLPVCPNRKRPQGPGLPG